MEQEERIPPMEQSTAPVDFRARKTVEQVEEQYELAPRFDADGLIVCVTTDAASGTVLMVGYMNRDALTKTIQTGEAHYWSRSRQTLWHKGATSGLIQQVKELRIDDDQDAVWLRECSRVWCELPCGLPLVFLSTRRRRRAACAGRPFAVCGARESIRPGGGLRRRAQPDPPVAAVDTMQLWSDTLPVILTDLRRSFPS